MTILTCLGDSITDCEHCFSRDFLGNGYVKMLSDCLKRTAQTIRYAIMALTALL